MNEQPKRGEELFDQLSQNRKKRKRKIIRTIVILLAVIAVILFAGVMHLRRQVQERFASSAAEVEHYEVASGTINTVVAGTGTLTEVDLEQLTLPEGVEITDILVEAGDTVAQGEILATADMASVMASLSDLQAQIKDLDSDIASAKGDTISSRISANISGRVKQLFAQTGDDVSAVMAEHGALAVLSLDGYMAVDLETDALQRNQEVVVLRADGTQIDGTAESAAGGKATILVTDKGPQFDEEVTVQTLEGEPVGTGCLYIHSPLSVTGYAGTISGVSVSENSYAYAYSTLFSLTDTSFSANYDSLLRQRSELEEKLLQLLTVYRDGAILAPWDGMVSSIEYDSEAEDTANLNEDGDIRLMTLYPNISMEITISIDETDILALQKGQEAEVTVSSVSEDVHTGLVTQINKSADTSSGVTYYSAVVTVDQADGMLPGMTADVDIKIEGVENALIIPVDALHQTRDTYYVFTTYDEETQQYGGQAEVTIGMQNDNYVEILTGLNLGDTVYYTEAQEFPFGGMGNMGGMPGGNAGGMPGGGMPSGMNRPGGDMGSRNRGG